MEEVKKSSPKPRLWHEGPEPDDDAAPVSWRVDAPVIGPAQHFYPSKRSPKEVMPNLDAGPSPLAARLCWRVPRHEKQR